MRRILKGLIWTAACVAVAAAVSAFSGCGYDGPAVVTATPMPSNTPSPTVTPTPYIMKTIGRFEAEDGKMNGNCHVVEIKGSRQISGEAYVDGFEQDEDYVTINAEIPEDGFYDLIFRLKSKGGEKTNFVYVDGNHVGDIYIKNDLLNDAVVGRIYLSHGTHEIEVRKSWGWICLDYCEITTAAPISEGTYMIAKKLSNPNASDNTKRLFSYLVDIYGKNFLSGQVCDEGMYGGEIQVIKNTTGKMPAILSMDFMNYTPSRPDGGLGHTVEFAKQWDAAGGIVEFHWHWTVGEKYWTPGPWYSTFYTEKTNFSLKKALNGQDKEGYEMLLNDIDCIAKLLKQLADEDIPVIFRPLHEASGGWFWWGASGAEAYKELYILLYDKLTNEYGLNNIIWLWNGQAADWYPGDEYCDIMGTDIYPGEKVYTSQVSKYLEVAGWSDEQKPVYLSECGCIFDPELAARDGAWWGCWCVWCGEFVKNPTFNKISEQYTEAYMMKKAYDSEYVITLDELPDLKTYPME